MRNRLSYRMLTLSAATSYFFVIGTGFSGVALGQGIPSVPGLTVLQQPVAVTLQSVCFALNGIPDGPVIAAPNPDGTPTEKLSNSCTKMVVSSLNNQGAPGLPTQFNLNLSNTEIGTGVQAIAPVQANAQKQMSAESSKMNLIGARLLNLRAGQRGFVVGTNDQDWQPASGSSANRTNLDGATGGAAGADDVDGPWGGFVNIGYAWGNVDQTDLQNAYNYGSFNLLAGADYRVSDSFVVGAAFAYSDTRSNYDAGLGNVKAATTGVIGYGTYYVDDWYIDGLLGYGSVNYDTTRNINIPSHNPNATPIVATATASPNGDQFTASIGVGRNFASGTYTVTPSVRLGYIKVKNKSFSEYEPVDGLALAVNERTIESLQSALGARVSTVINTASGVLGPYFTAQWMHEFKNDSPSIVSKYVADPTNQFFAIPTSNPTRDYAILMVGSTATFPNSLSAFLQFSAAVGLNNETNYGVVLGVRKQF
jgi:outer membrane lipase/esterase